MTSSNGQPRDTVDKIFQVILAGACISLVAACGEELPPPQPPPHFHAPRSVWVFFAPGSFVPTPGSLRVLSMELSNPWPPAKFALQQDNPRKICVYGHADRTGSEVENERLSMQRAEWVANYLSEAGVQKERLIVRGFGSSRPIVPTLPNTPEPQNRRAEILWIDC